MPGHRPTGALYRRPEIYEAAFAYRDLDAEVEALLAWHRRHGAHPLRSVLELAAGPAAHAIGLARRGLRATALDTSPDMCAHARRRARAAGVPLEVVQADMADFRLPRRHHLAITMCNSASHLLDLDTMVGHLRCVARALMPRGVYVIELAHPADFLSTPPRTAGRWRARRDGWRVDLRWGSPGDRFDPVTQVAEETITARVQRSDGVEVVTDRLRLRRWTATEMEGAVRLAGGFELVARHGSFDVDSPFDGGPDGWRMILVLVRRPGRLPPGAP